MSSLTVPQITASEVLNTPSRTQIFQLFALAEHELSKGRLAEALILFRFIASIDPSNTDAGARIALILFRREQWNEAWDAFDIRFKLMGAEPKVTARNADGIVRAVPRWRGGPLPKHLLVMDEQGFGDTLNFVRFLKPLSERGVKITFVTHPQLFKLIKSMDLTIDLKRNDESGSVPGVTAWVPLLNIPRALGLEPQEYTASVPYLKADRVSEEKWRKKLDPKAFKIGIVWSGNPNSPADKGRSMPLETFAPLAAIPGVQLISLQKGEAALEAGTVAFAKRVKTLGDEFDSSEDAFIDSAAVMMSLDLIVSVDTAIVHLAGALGRPVHVLLQKNPDWRWLSRESDSVWYPTAQLFRQQELGDWSEPVSRVCSEIGSLMKTGVSDQRKSGPRGKATRKAG